MSGLKAQGILPLERCPQCGGRVQLVWTREDGKVRGYRCVRGHRYIGGRLPEPQLKHPVYLVKEGEAEERAAQELKP